MLLTLARIWTTLATGEIRPKDAAADWAIAQCGDDGVLLARARDAYLAGREESWTDDADAVRRLAGTLIDRIRGGVH